MSISIKQIKKSYDMAWEVFNNSINDIRMRNAEVKIEELLDAYVLSVATHITCDVLKNLDVELTHDSVVMVAADISHYLVAPLAYYHLEHYKKEHPDV